MVIKKRLLDVFLEEEEFSLFGIHCTIEDYRLAYLLNKTLALKLNRLDKDIDNNNNKTEFSVFEWKDNLQFNTYHLVSNSCKLASKQEQSTVDALFSFNPIKTYHLVPEFSKANYFLKIEKPILPNKEKLILEKILKIGPVITAYSINSEHLKSKDQLIFN